MQIGWSTMFTVRVLLSGDETMTSKVKAEPNARGSFRQGQSLSLSSWSQLNGRKYSELTRLRWRTCCLVQWQYGQTKGNVNSE